MKASMILGAIPGICLVVLCICLCLYTTYKIIREKKYKMLPFITILLVFWQNIITEILIIVYHFLVRSRTIKTIACISIAFLYYYLNILNIILMIFLTIERYIQICCSPQLYAEKIKKRKKKSFYIVIFVIGQFLTFALLNWAKLLDSRIEGSIECRMSEWFGIYNGNSILIAINIIFYIVTITTLCKMHYYLKKNQPMGKETLLDSATFNMFRSGHLVSSTCVEVFKMVLAIVICHILFYTPLQFLSVFYNFQFSSTKMTRESKIGGYLIGYFTGFYVLFLEISYLYFSRIISDTEKSEIHNVVGENSL